MEASNQKRPRRNPAHYIREPLVAYTAAWAAPFKTEVEASCRKRSYRRDRDSKKRNRENLDPEFVGRFVACSDTTHYKTVRSLERCRLILTLQHLQRSNQRRWVGLCSWPTAGLAPTPPPCSSLLMATNASTLGYCRLTPGRKETWKQRCSAARSMPLNGSSLGHVYEPLACRRQSESLYQSVLCE